MAKKNNKDMFALLEADLKRMQSVAGNAFMNECKKRMTEGAEKALEMFYDDYPEPDYPKYYNRHHNFFDARTRKSMAFLPYSTSSGGRYYGGIKLTPERIPNVYKSGGRIDNPLEVYDTVMNGFHGLSSVFYDNPPRMAVSPFEYIYDTRDTMIKDLDEIFDNAVNIARKEKYAVLKI